MFGKRDNTDRVRKKRVKLHEVTSENDIRYRGPLSFFHFQILGWLCIVLSQVALIFVAYVEGIHQILYLLPVGRVSLDELKEMIAVGTSMIQ